MASNLTANDIFVSPTVYELMVIEVNNRSFQSKELRYQIQDASNKILRKGSFTGCSIQLRLNSLYEGDYTITLQQEQGDSLLVANFKKCKEEDMFINYQIAYYKMNAV